MKGAFERLLEVSVAQTEWGIRFRYFEFEIAMIWGGTTDRPRVWALVVDSFKGFS